MLSLATFLYEDENTDGPAARDPVQFTEDE